MDVPTVRGHSGLSLAAIGLDTYSLDGDEGTNTVTEAIRIGYRLLDSAFNYEKRWCRGRRRATLGPTTSRVDRYFKTAGTPPPI